VQDIIRELQMTLDPQYDISYSFDQLYDYMHRCLVNANMEKNTTIVQEVIGYFRDFRDAGKEAMKISRTQNPNPNPA
jgi:flagellar protein FliS